MGIVALIGEKYGMKEKTIKRIAGILDLSFWVIFMIFFVMGLDVYLRMAECSDLIRCEYFGAEYNASYRFKRDFFNMSINETRINNSIFVNESIFNCNYD